MISEFSTLRKDVSHENKFENRSGNRLYPSHLESAILALNVWQKNLLRILLKIGSPRSPEFRKTCVIVNLPKLSYNIENGGKGVDLSYS